MNSPGPLCSSRTAQPGLHVVGDGCAREDEPDPATVAASIDAARLRRLVAELPTLHRLVVTWRYGLKGLTLGRREIAARLNYDPWIVREIEQEALQMMRAAALGERKAA